MYLQQVFRFNKWLFALCILFAAGQLFINAKRGMVLSPFYHYGMYSQVMPVQTSYNVFRIDVNGTTLQGSNYSPWQWDKIMWPVVYYSQLNNSNRLYNEDAKRLMQRINLRPQDKHFLTACNYSQFESWYKQYLASVINQRVETLSIGQTACQYVAGELRPGQTFTPLQQLCR